MKKVKNNSTVAEKEALNSNAFEGGVFIKAETKY